MMRGLLENDNNWIETIREAIVFRSPSQLRDLFAIIIVNCNPSDPLAIYDEFKEEMAEDILHRHEGINGPRNFTDFILNESLIEIENKVQELGGQDLLQFGLPAPNRENRNVPTDVIRESSYDMNELQIYIEENEPRLIKYFWQQNLEDIPLLSI